MSDFWASEVLFDPLEKWLLGKRVFFATLGHHDALNLNFDVQLAFSTA